MTDQRLVYGFHAVLARLRERAGAVSEVLIAADRHDARMRDLARRAQEAGVRVTEVASARLDGLCAGGRHQGVVARISAAVPKLELEDLIDAAGSSALLLVLDGVQDPHNLGACLRVADGMGVQGVIAPRDRAVGLTPVVAKVAAGAAETVPYVQVTNLARALDALKEAGIWTMAATQDATTALDGTRLTGPVAWVLGAEGAGLRRLTRERCDEAVRIPMVGQVESLNVSVAAAICLYESLRQRRAADRLNPASPAV